MENNLQTALRSEYKPRYRDIDTDFMRRVGRAFSEGYTHYEEPFGMIFEKNYQKGDLAFALRAIDHAIEHLYEYKDSVLASLQGHKTDISEDHLGHAGANLSMLAWFERAGYFRAPLEEPQAVTKLKKPVTERESESWRGTLMKVFDL